MKRTTKLAMVAAIAGGLGLASAAQAAPLPANPGLSPEATVETVAGGCGPGWVPNVYGVCRPRPFYRPYYARPVVVVRPFYRPYRPWGYRRW